MGEGDDLSSTSSGIEPALASTYQVHRFWSEVTRTGPLLLAGNTISTVIWALAMVAVARLLGPEAYGLYSLVLLTPTFLAYATDLGLPTSLTHFSARAHSDSDNDRVGLYLSTSISVGIAVGTLSTVAAILSSSFISASVINRPGTETLVALGSMVMVPQIIYALLTHFFAAIEKPKYSAATSIAEGAFKGLLQLSLVVLGYSVAGVTAGYVGGILLGALFGLGLLLVKVRPKRLLGVDISSLKRMLVYGLPFYLCIFLYQLIAQYEGILMGELATDAQIGNYKTATNFMIVLTTTVAPLSSTFVPAFSRFDHIRDRGVLKDLFRKGVKYASLMTLPLAAAVIVLSNDGVYALFEDQYALAPLYLSLLALHSVFSPLGANVIANSFNGLGKSHYVLAVNGIWTLVFMVLARPVTVTFGIPGMIVLFTASWMPALAAGLIIADRKFGMRLDASWSARAYLATTGAALGTWLLVNNFSLGKGWPNLLIGIPAFGLMLLVLYPLLCVIDEADLTQVESLAALSPRIRHALNPIIRLERRLVAVSPFKATSSSDVG